MRIATTRNSGERRVPHPPLEPHLVSGCWSQEQNKVMAVGRYQVPLAPAFAITAHASQGQTLNAAIVDLQQGNGVSVIASYVAITRVRCRADLIIYRPFDRQVFSGGPLLGPSTLLKQLRGETIDWEEIQDRLQPRQRCGGCHMRKGKPQYDLAEWRAEEEGWCRACVEEKVEAGTVALPCIVPGVITGGRRLNTMCGTLNMGADAFAKNALGWKRVGVWSASARGANSFRCHME